MATFTVSPTGPYYTIQDGIDAAESERVSSGQNQTVVVYPKPSPQAYTENITISKGGITVNGIIEGAVRVFLQGSVTVSISGTPIADNSVHISQIDCQNAVCSGTNFQEVYLNDVNASSSDTAITMTNVGYSGSVYSRIYINGGSYTTSNAAEYAINQSNGYIYANKCSFNAPSIGQSMNITSWDEQGFGGKVKVGVESSSCSIVGQIYLDPTSPIADYANLSLTNTKVSCTGSGILRAPILAVEDSVIQLVTVTLSNPESYRTVNATADSKVFYRNITVPAGTGTAAVSDIPRSRIEADVPGFGGIVVNDANGRLATMLGTANGQVPVWSAFAHAWIPAAQASATSTSYTFTVPDVTGWSEGDILAINRSTGDLTIASNDSEDTTSVVGAIQSIVPSGSEFNVSVVVSGVTAVSTPLPPIGNGNDLYLGADGSVVEFADITDDDWVVFIGRTIDSGTNTALIQPRVVGIK